MFQTLKQESEVENCDYHRDDAEQQHSDYEILPDHIPNTKRLNEIVETVRDRTGKSLGCLPI